MAVRCRNDPALRLLSSWLTGLAFAANVAVVAPDGPIRPGKPTHLQVAVVDDLGFPSPSPPTVTMSGGLASVAATPVRLGVYEVNIVPPEVAGPLQVSITAFGRTTTTDFTVEEVAPSTLKLPAKLEFMAGDNTVDVLVTGPDLPPADALDVVIAEGSVVGVEAAPGGLVVHLALPETTFPRVIPFGVRDERKEVQPTWGGIRLHTRTTIDLYTEPGAKLTLTVGRRTYGPFVADASGVVRPVIDQYPGELAAQALLVDDVGNETHTTLTLTASAQASFVAMVGGQQVPGRQPPDVFVYGVHGDGHTWDGAAPACKTPSANLLVKTLAPGAWRAALPAAERPQEVRVRCAVGSAAETSVRLPVSGNVPATIDLRVVPDELSTDFPVAEIRAVLFDMRGDRMESRGLVLGADLGTVEAARGASGTALHGEYDGKSAISKGGDTIWARFDLPPGQGPVAELSVAYGFVDRLGPVRAHVRALDADGLPLAGVPVDVHATPGDFAVVSGVTGPDGWAAVDVRAAPGLDPVAIEARSNGRVGRAVALRDSRPRGGPGSFDLRVERKVAITTGRVNVIDVALDPEVLYTGQRAQAHIDVHVRDRAGAVVPSRPDEITVSEGAVGPWEALPDGGWRAVYTPGDGDRARSVDLVVRAGSASSQARLTLEPRPIEASAVFGFGLVTNFGALFSPQFTADFDWRRQVFQRPILVRMGVGWYGAGLPRTAIEGGEIENRTRILPITVALLARGDFRGDSLWGGISGTVAPWVRQETFVVGADEVRFTQLGMYGPGIGMIGGVGRRVGTGEILLELRATALTASSRPSEKASVAFFGPMGGLSTIFGYRVIF